MESELYLALISWAGVRPGTRLGVCGIDTLLSVLRLQIQVPDTGRMLLVIDRSTRVELRGAGIGRAQRRRQSIRILMGRGGRARLRRVTGGLLPLPRHGLRAVSGSILKVSSPILEAGDLIAAAHERGILRASPLARHRTAIRPVAAPVLRAGNLAVVSLRRLTRVTVSARQRRHAASFSARLAADPQRGHHSP